MNISMNVPFHFGAKPNDADPYLYIRFLYDAKGKVKKGDNLDDLMPWSAKFRDYAVQNAHADEEIPESCKIPEGKLKIKGIKVA